MTIQNAIREKMTYKLCIFGASGATGTILTKLAVKRGLDVTVFVRSEIAREIFPQGVTVVVGNLLNPGDVERAITGCKAVICAFGPRTYSPNLFCAEATQNIIDAMKAQGIKRLLCITGAMIGNYPYLSWFIHRIMSTY
jgi:putative NADH-flavin reductase